VTTRLGVVGWPVAHSRSPAMHAAALAAAGLDRWRYQALGVAPDDFGDTVRALPALGFRGVNVTIPHKEAALAVADDASPAARTIGAANTLTFAGGAIHADNTDAPGLLAALTEEGMGYRSALVLGAGGSARAVAYALREAGTRVRVWNRTAARAHALAGELGVEAVDGVVPAELLVNCTAVGLDDQTSPFKALALSADALDAYACVVDLVYRDGGTELLHEARRRGLRTVDGLEVLVHQGALSFEIWTGAPAPVEEMRRAARGERFPRQPLRSRSAPGDGGLRR
jgi:shikimate dehydrogenase